MSRCEHGVDRQEALLTLKKARVPRDGDVSSDLLFKGFIPMNQVNNLLKNFTQDESGATAIEYGLLAALVALGIAAGATTLGTELGAFFGRVATRLAAAG